MPWDGEHAMLKDQGWQELVGTVENLEIRMGIRADDIRYLAEIKDKHEMRLDEQSISIENIVNRLSMVEKTLAPNIVSPQPKAEVFHKCGNCLLSSQAILHWKEVAKTARKKLQSIDDVMKDNCISVSSSYFEIQRIIEND